MSKLATETSSRSEEVVVRATPEAITPEIRQQVERIRAELEKELTAAAEATIEEAAIGVGPVVPTLVWNLLSFGPIRLGGPTGPGAPPNRPNKVVPAGSACVMFGISWAPNPLTQGYLAAKPYTASCSIRNMTTMTPGPTLTTTGPGPGPGLNSLFAVFPFVFIAPGVPGGAGPGTQPHLFEIDFTIDIEGGGVGFEGAGYANWHFDPDNALAIGPLGLPPQPAQWRNGMSGRMLVHAFPG